MPRIRLDKAFEQKSQADSIAALNSSIAFSMTGKAERPLSLFIHVMIGSGNSIQIDFSEHVRNFNQQIQPIRQAYPLSIADFSLGFVKGLPKGVYDSGAGLCAFATSVVQHPLQTGVQVLDALALLRDLACSEQWNALSKTLAPEIHQLVTEWDTIPSSVRGELAGYALGKYGSDIIIPGALAKAVSRGIKGARELNGLYSGLQAVEQNFLQESVGVANSVKIGEIVQVGQNWNPVHGPGPIGLRHARSFRGASYIETIIPEKVILYRVYGENAKMLGHYWTRTPPFGILQSKLDSALLTEWGNSAHKIVKIQLPKGTRIFEGAAAPQKTVLENLPGGGNQVFLENVSPEWIIP